ncbi:MAG TPA: hypothetical protein HPP97_15335 [Desulfuromonadales bacterium]|nr:hypothetical protein [Desulfuromonadales bacterium]
MAIFLNIIAKTMNAGGCAIVTAFDAGAAAFNCTMSALSPGERTKLGNRVKELERKIHALTGGIAKETSKFADPAAALESEAVRALLNAVKELHKEIEPLKQRIAEIDALKGVKKPQQETGCISSTIAQSITGLLPGEKAGLQKRIFANEKKIQALYVEFAKEVAKQPDPYEAINSKAVAAINTKINELHAENSTFKQQIADLAKPKEKPKAAEKKQQPDAKKPQPEVKKPQPESAGVAKFFIHAITNSVSGYLPGEKSTVERKLAEHDKKIQSLYLEVAKESAKYPDPSEAVTAAPVVALVTKINVLKAEVATLNERKAELSGVGKGKPTSAAAKATATQAKAEPVSEDVPAPSPLSPETVVVVDAVDTVDASAAVPETESDAVAETAVHGESASSELPEAAEQAESDPSEGTPYVNSRTKSCDIAEPILQPPTEEDIKAVVRDIQAEDALGEQAREEAVAPLEEPFAMTEPAVEEEPAVAADVSVEAVAMETDTEEHVVVEHPPFVPVPEAEEVFGVYDADAGINAVTGDAPQETMSEVETAESGAAETAAAEADTTDDAAPALQDESEIYAEPAVETTSEEVVDNPPAVTVSEDADASLNNGTIPAEAITPTQPSTEESPAPAMATSARADAFAVTAEYSTVIPASRPENVIKEESGFRTRLFRNQFSILTPVPVETPVPNLEPPTREEIETVVRALPADDVEKYKLNDILEEHGAVTGADTDAEEPSEPEAAVPEGEKADEEQTDTEEADADESEVDDSETEEAGTGEPDVPDYYKKLSERRKALLAGAKDPSGASGKGSPKKRK